MIAEKEKNIIDLYKKDMTDILKLIYPSLTREYIDNALDYSIKNRYNEVTAHLNNSYTKTKQDMNLFKLTNWILKKEPIMTAYGVLFKKHADTENPLIDMIAMFMNNREIHKK